MGQINDKINALIMGAMKERNSVKANAYKNMKAKFIEFTTAKNAKPLDDSAEISIIKKMVKELENDAELFKEHGRIDLAEANINEVGYLKEFLPKEATSDDINKAIDTWIADNGTIEKKNMGLVIKYVKSQLAGADGKTVSELVMKRL